MVGRATTGRLGNDVVQSSNLTEFHFFPTMKFGVGVANIARDMILFFIIKYTQKIITYTGSFRLL